VQTRKSFHPRDVSPTPALKHITHAPTPSPPPAKATKRPADTTTELPMAKRRRIARALYKPLPVRDRTPGSRAVPRTRIGISSACSTRIRWTLLVEPESVKETFPRRALLPEELADVVGQLD